MKGVDDIPGAVPIVTALQKLPLSFHTRSTGRTEVQKPSVLGGTCESFGRNEAAHHRLLPLRAGAIHLFKVAGVVGELPLSIMPAAEWRTLRLRVLGASRQLSANR
jgi:hypothetical protein